MTNAEDAYEDPALSLAQYCVPHGGRVGWALDRMPGTWGVLGFIAHAPLDQLRPGGHPPVLSVDEEDRHAGGEA